MYHLLCSSYNVTSKGLLLRNNFIEFCPNDSSLLDIIEKWGLPDDFKYPQKGTISCVLEGDLEDVVIHVRIVRF